MVGKFLPAALPLYTVEALAFMYWTTKYTDYNSLLQFRLWRRAERYVITRAVISRHCFDWVHTKTVENCKSFAANFNNFRHFEKLWVLAKAINREIGVPSIDQKFYSGVCTRPFTVCVNITETVYEVLKRYLDVEHIWVFPLKSLARG
jgi:hypothetical protein